MKQWLTFLFTLCILTGAGGLTCRTVQAADVAVVDTVKVFAESEPGKAGTEHMRQVMAILQKGYDDLASGYKGKEDSPEAQNDLGRASAMLQQEMAGQEQLVNAELHRCLTEAVAQWRTRNRGFVLVLPKSVALGADGKIEITRAVLAEMNKVKATFPPLPQVSVKRAGDAPKPEKKK